MGKPINDYPLVNCDITSNIEKNIFKEINEELYIVVDEKDIIAKWSHNFEQKYAYAMILKKVFNEEPVAFFIDGLRGSGKTYLYRAIIIKIKSNNLIAPATSSRVVVSILFGRWTTHLRFKIPLNIEDSNVCNVSKQLGLDELFQTAKIIIWDEAPMSKWQSIKCLDRMLWDITYYNILFGYKVIVLGGDFCQVLPIIPRETRKEIINTSLLKSYLWSKF